MENRVLNVAKIFERFSFSDDSKITLQNVGQSPKSSIEVSIKEIQ